MKYRPEERMDIGRRIYDGELSCRTAAEIYGINKHTAKRYLWLYRDTLGLPPKVGRPKSLSKVISEKAFSSTGEMKDYESMTRDELITELVMAKINEARAKKGYEVKGVGVEKEYIVYDSKNTK